jgi:hypothetical protein
MLFICDDVSTKYLNQLWKLECLKKKYPKLKVLCFVIAENTNQEFLNWLNKEWIEVGLHGYSHGGIPECEKENKEELIKKSFEILKGILPNKYSFRAPGFQMTASTYPILKDIGVSYIVHERKIQDLFEKKTISPQILNVHIYDKLQELVFDKSIKFEFVYESINNNASKI